MTRACILGCAGLALRSDEAEFFRRVDPWGFILFRRNVASSGQVQALTAGLRQAVGRPDAPILIDQEGGRVQRMGPPNWRRYPPARAYGDLRSPLARRADLARIGGRLMARDLAAAGVNVDCAPVLDVPASGSHDVIGDRAFAELSEDVAVLGRAMAEGLLAGGVLPVVKHMPGHGRAGVDSHHDLPIVRASLAEMEGSDFAPFRALRDMPAAMTAHVLYTAIDADRPCTTSPIVIERLIRGVIGFEGLLVSDDLSMAALGGDLAARAGGAIGAGCDVVLHCNGLIDEMAMVAAATPLLTGASGRRADAALARLSRTPMSLVAPEEEARFDAWLATRAV